MMNTAQFNIEEELKKLPAKPGVYIMHDRDDRIIYVGKAVILKNRVRSYFRESTTKTLKIQTMVSKIAWFEYVVTDSELEALVLENNLIKEHKPKYNTLLKDDKTYPYIKVTVDEDYPRIIMTRKVKKDSAKYYGPYTSAGSVKNTIELLCKLYKIRTCSMKITDNQVYSGESNGNEEVSELMQSNIRDACLYYHIHQCLAPCLKNISKEEYREAISGALDFLNGNYRPLIKSLEDKMQEASNELRFEDAMEYRDLLSSVKDIAQKQKITDTGGEDKDIVAMAREGAASIIQVFFVRDGKIIGREHYYMKQTEDTTDAEIIRNFVMQFYEGTPFIPKELIIPVEIEDLMLCQEWLTKKRGAKVLITVPKKGKKEKLVELAEKNAHIVLQQDLEKVKRNEARNEGAMQEIMDLLAIDNIHRVEAYDISNISGYDSVGSMVVFVDGRPKKNDYRKFRIKSVDGPNDYASMKEVLTRRFEHGNDDKFGRLPELILMDGGRGQVNIALDVMREMGISIPVCGMVKDDNHRTRGLYFNNVEIPISHSSEGFKLITRVQDEAHRFAIEFHRSLRSKGQTKSILDDIKGVGPKRRKSIMKNFSSLDEVRNADIDTLMSIPSLDKKSAQAIYDYFHNEK